MVISFDSSTNACEETDITIFYNGLSSLVRYIPNQTVIEANERKTLSRAKLKASR